MIKTLGNLETKYRQRKFLLACFSLWVITIALFTGNLEGGEFNVGLALILGLYGAQAYYGSKEDRAG